MAALCSCLLLLVLAIQLAAGTSEEQVEVPLCGGDVLDGSRRDHVVALPQEGSSLSIRLFDNDTGLLQPVRCTLRVETCPSCVLNFKYQPPSSDLTDEEIRSMSACQESLLDPCFDLRFVEEKADTTLDLIYQKISIWDEPTRNSVVSTSSMTVVMLTIWNLEPNSSISKFTHKLFPFTVTSVSNEEFIEGTPSDNLLYPNLTAVGFIESPRYPAAYPKQLLKTYALVNANPRGYVRLIFDDFHIHYQSALQILDSDGSVLVNTQGENRRPPAVVSKGAMLTIKFEAHDFTQAVGFRARYDFVETQEWPEKPNSRNCDELFEGYGGEIKLDGNSHLANTYVDCIWVIGRFLHTSRTFDRIFLRVEEFHLKGVGIRLEIREGASSTSDRLLLLYDAQTRDQLEHKQPRHGFTTSLANPAYYVRLRGFLMSTTGLEIVYTQFYRWATAVCPGTSEFHCDNSRCIKASLRCDSVDNCGDASDELCTRPGTDFRAGDSDVSGLIALVVGVCGLIVLLIATTSVMAKVYRRRITSQLNTAAARAQHFGGEMAPSIQTVGERRFYVVPENQISVIEAPPSYDDALKHPPVRSDRNCYANHGFHGSLSEERALSPVEPPPALEGVEDLPNEPSTSRAPTSRVVETPPADESRPSTSSREDHEESWV